MKFQTFVFFLLINVYLCQNKPSVSIIDTYVTWQNLGTETEFTITSPLGGLNVNDAWIAVGVNDGPIMYGANAVVCRHSSTKKTVEHYLNGLYTSALMDPLQPTLGLNNSKIAVVGSNLTCSFTRANKLDYALYVKIDSSSSLNILVAYGQGEFGRHSNKGSSGKIDFGTSTISDNNFSSYIWDFIVGFFKALILRLFGLKV